MLEYQVHRNGQQVAKEGLDRDAIHLHLHSEAARI